MKNEQLFKNILEIYNTQKPCNIHRKIKLQPELVDEIIKNTQFILEDNDYSFSIRIFCYINSITQYPACATDGKQIRNNGFLNIKRGFSRYCSCYCSHHSKDVKQKCMETKIKRFGNPFFNNKDKARQTRYFKYNGQYLEPDHMQKVRKTNLERYGAEYYCNHEKTECTNIEKYGVKTPLQLNNFRRNPDKTKYSYFNVLMKNKYDKPVFSFEEYKQRSSYRDQLEFRCRKCGKIFMAVHDNGIHRQCPLCYPANITISNLNRRIYNILNNAGISYTPEYFIRENEIIRFYDIKFDNGVFLEINGDYWHANPVLYADTDYLNIPDKGKIQVSEIHMKDKLKAELAERHGFKVIYLWENDMTKMTDDEIFKWLKIQCKI